MLFFVGQKLAFVGKFTKNLKNIEILLFFLFIETFSEMIEKLSEPIESLSELEV